MTAHNNCSADSSYSVRATRGRWCKVTLVWLAFPCTLPWMKRLRRLTVRSCQHGVIAQAVTRLDVYMSSSGWYKSTFHCGFSVEHVRPNNTKRAACCRPEGHSSLQEACHRCWCTVVPHLHPLWSLLFPLWHKCLVHALLPKWQSVGGVWTEPSILSNKICFVRSLICNSYFFLCLFFTSVTVFYFLPFHDISQLAVHECHINYSAFLFVKNCVLLYVTPM